MRIVPRLPHKSHQQCTLCQTCHAKAGETKGHWRNARACTLCQTCHTKAGESKGHWRDARASVRPLGSAHCPTLATQKRLKPKDTGGTPKHASNPWQVHSVPRLPRKRRGDQETPEGRQGVRRTTWQCTLSHACHAKAAETNRHQKDAKAYMRPLGSAQCPTSATQKRRKPRAPEGCQGVRRTNTYKRRRPRDTGGTSGRASDHLAVHTVPRLPRKKKAEDQRILEGREGVHPAPSK